MSVRDLFVSCVRLEARISSISIVSILGYANVCYIYVMFETGVKNECKIH